MARYNPAVFPRLTEAEYYAEEREADRVTAFCYSGLGHQRVMVDHTPTEKITYCDDCGTELHRDRL